MARLKMNFENIEDEGLRKCKHKTEENADVITRVVDSIVDKHCHELDEAVDDVYRILHSSREISIADLNYYIALIPTQMYYVGNALENIGIQGDSAAAIRRERFDKAYLEVEGKTINDKQSAANQLVISETLIEQAFSRAYKKTRSRLDYADSILNSLKKILQWRMSEMEVTGHTKGEGTNFQARNNRRI